jgi:NitT/TauT family transport system ATP-binding protein
MYDTPGRSSFDTDVRSFAGGSSRTIRAGFIQLLDCAVLAVAAEKSFAREEGIDLQLAREASWANVRDRITVGHLECA